jgi:O-antigen/teichoic acid export membrane protein
MRLTDLKNKPEFIYSLWMFSAQVGVSISAFFVTYILANYVADDVVGSYRYILAVYSSVSVFALIGLSTALSHSVANGKTGSYLTALRLKFVYSSAASLLFFSLAGYTFLFQQQNVLAVALVVTGFSFPIIETFGLYLPYLNGKADFKKSAIFLLSNRVLTALFLVGSVFLDNGLLVLLSAYLAGQIISVYVLHKLTLSQATPNEHTDEGMHLYAKHVTLMSVIGAITAQLDKFILFFFFGPVALAKFWIASVLPQEMNRGVSIIVNTFFPRFAKGEKSKNKTDIKILFFGSSLAMIFVIVSYSLVAPTLFQLFLPLHVDAVNMSLLLMAAYGFVPYYFVWQVFSAQKNVKIMYILNTAEPIILILGYLIFVPLYGVLGIICTIFIKNLVFNLHGLYYVLRTS